jgi:outer membrane protein assembly factor BamC
VKQSAKFGLLAMCAALSACSVLEGDKIDYKSASKGRRWRCRPT